MQQALFDASQLSPQVLLGLELERLRSSYHLQSFEWLRSSTLPWALCPTGEQ